MTDTLTLAYVRSCVHDFRFVSDAETSHLEEDKLHFIFFEQLAAGKIKPTLARDIATEFLTIRDMVRWFA